MRLTYALLASSLALVGCAPSLDQTSMANASVACLTGATWNGSPASVLYVGVDKGVAGTKGGIVSVECGAAKAGFTDQGNLTPMGQSVRVPLEVAPMKISPR